MDEGENKITIDHEEIKSWVESRGGKPARVKGTGGDDVGLLRIMFVPQEDLEEISWEKFFEKFEEKNLAFLYQDITVRGEESRFFKFIKR